MRFQLTTDWPACAHMGGTGTPGGPFKLYPAGTIIERNNDFGAPWPMPVTAAAMDQSSYDELRKLYPRERILIAGEGINRW
jgi:hypothetical protein